METLNLREILSLRKIAGTIAAQGLRVTLLKIVRVIGFLTSNVPRRLSLLFLRCFHPRVIVHVNGFRMKLDVRNPGIARELYLWRNREHLTTAMFTTGRLVLPGQVVLEAGANIGYYALLASRLIGEGGTLYCVEPAPANVNALQENLRMNDVRNAEICNLALGDETGTAKLYVSRRPNLCRLESGDNSDIVQVVDVPITTVDSFLQGRTAPHLVRMDVEGYEWRILRGMTRTLQRHGPKLLVEVHGHLMSEEQLTEFFRILETADYQVLRAFVNPHEGLFSVNWMVKWSTKKLGQELVRSDPWLDLSLAELHEHVRRSREVVHALFGKKSNSEHPPVGTGGP